MFYTKRTVSRIMACIFAMCISVLMLQMNETGANAIIKIFAPYSILQTNNNTSISVMGATATEQRPSEALPSYSTNCKILIYHTHTNEAYLESAQNRYENLAGRSPNSDLTVQAAGSALSDMLISLGFDNDHDTTDNETNGYNQAYKQSATLINSNIKQNGEYTVYIDLHRDAYTHNSIPTVEINGKSVAKIMFVVGGKSPTATKNREFANKVAAELNAIHPNLCEKVLFASNSKYNQDYSDKCLLIEVGDNAVTVEEACNAAEYVAIAIGRVLAKEGTIFS
ncbi:MAG: hypothetical protein E7312_01075 [Clostridiales bacterium]|nr:hypothetical protein [Clostridiales bacterium]